jgi:hypothetical protein
MPVMAEKNPAGRKRVRKGYNLQVWIDSLVGECAERFLREHEPRTDKTGLAEAALKKFLTEYGYWPPPPANGQS